MATTPTPPPVPEQYRRAQDIFDTVLAAVPADGLDTPSACPGWTVRDIADHVIGGQQQLAAWANGRDDHSDGAAGGLQPAPLTGDPLANWRAARTVADAALTEEGLARTVTLGPLGDRSVAAIVTLLVTDLLTHSWDIAHAVGHDLRLDPDLVAGSLAWAQDNICRAPGFYGPELTPPADADDQTRWLAYLGRAAWQPATT